MSKAINLLKLHSELDSALCELSCGDFGRRDLYQLFYRLLVDCGVDSREVVKILETYSDEDSKDVVLGIKVNEGW